MQTHLRSTFSKRERLVSQKLIEELFGGSGSRSMAAYPLRAVYLLRECTPYDAPVQLLLSVPKKRFRHAVDRNRVKRQLREAYRHRLQSLRAAIPAGRQLLLAFVWLSDRHLPSTDVDSRVGSLLQRLTERMAHSPNDK